MMMLLQYLCTHDKMIDFLSSTAFNTGTRRWECTFESGTARAQEQSGDMHDGGGKLATAANVRDAHFTGGLSGAHTMQNE